MGCRIAHIEKFPDKASDYIEKSPLFVYNSTEKYLTKNMADSIFRVARSNAEYAFSDAVLNDHTVRKQHPKEV